MNSITKRWIKGSLLIIIALLIMASAFLLLTFRNSYYSAAQTALSNRINTINGTLNASGRMSETEREELLFRLTSDFAEKDKFELMLLGEKGQVVATSSGFTPASRQNADDFISAASAGEELYINTYKSQMSEKIMSATFIMEEPARDVYAVRITTSLAKIDQEIGVFFAFIVFAAAMIVVFKLDSANDKSFGLEDYAPEYAYSITSQVQGMAIAGNKLVLSTSYSIAKSHLYIYNFDKVRASGAGKTTAFGEEIALYYVDSSSLDKDVKAPPMAEELVYLDGKIFVMNESACAKYIFGRFTSGNYVHAYKIDKIDK